jgi:hypothetical protein
MRELGDGVVHDAYKPPETQAGSSGGGVGGLGRSPGGDVYEPPSWWNEANRRKVLDGTMAVDGTGTSILNGGHRAGRGWPGKTEFPVT